MSSLQTVVVRVHASDGRDADRAVLETDAGQTVERRCATCGSTDHGRPTVAEGGVSMSRAAGVFVTAVSPGPVGVDVASIKAVNAAPLDVFDASERAMLDAPERAHFDRARTTAVLWAAKEAVLKLDGRGLVLDPRAVVVSADLTEATWPSAGRPGGTSSRTAVLDVRDLPGGLVLVVATEQTDTEQTDSAETHTVEPDAADRDPADSDPAEPDAAARGLPTLRAPAS